MILRWFFTLHWYTVTDALFMEVFYLRRMWYGMFSDVTEWFFRATGSYRFKFPQEAKSWKLNWPSSKNIFSIARLDTLNLNIKRMLNWFQMFLRPLMLLHSSVTLWSKLATSYCILLVFLALVCWSMVIYHTISYCTRVLENKNLHFTV